MTERNQVSFGNTVISYTVIRSSRRRKTVEITLDPSAGVLVAAPMDVPSEKIEEVVARRASWIVRQASSEVLHPQPKEFVSGESLPYLGRQVRLTVEHRDVRQVDL